MSGLNIRKDACELDFLALGAVVHRLDPGVIPFRKARSLDIHVSGGEYNVAANLSDCFGLQDRHRHRDGQLRHRRTGPGPRPRDGRHAVLQVVRARRRARPEHRHRLQRPRPRRPRRRWSSTTARTRPARCSSPATSTGRGSSPAACAGSTPAASSRPCPRPRRELIIEGMQAAKKAGAINSFDLNYRAKLWAPIGGAASRPSRRCGKIVSNVDALIGNEEDLQKGLGIAGPGGRSSRSRSSTPRRSSSMIERVVEAVPEHQDGGDDAARSPLDQPPRLGGRAVARRQAVRQPDVPARRDRPHRRRRRLRGRPDLRPARRARARRRPCASAGRTAPC